ncbi:alpha/beta hydrolase [Paraflavisolibacter sp. H34]|uniref:alpha/beta fold hydrolase n=1 Tax=Huijunlia imazamoxiresistens TaxID=3127457 RepID=UPI0030188FA9
MALLVLALLFADLLSIAFLFLDIHLWREWHEYRNTAADDYADRCLYGAIALLAYMALMGRPLILRLLSKKRPGEKEPHLFESDRKDRLERPDGTVINIEYYGPADAQPLILVHGWNSNQSGWFYQRQYFEKEYRLILVDLPGLGKSTRPKNKDFSLSKMAQDINAVIEFTGAKNAVLWGHSIGGMTLLTLLAKHAQSLTYPPKGLILEHTTFTNPVKTILFAKLMMAIQKPVLVPICYLLIALSPLVWISRWMSYLNGNSHLFTRLLTFTGTQSPKQLDFVTLLSTLAPPAVTARGVLGMFRYDVTGELPRIQLPVLVIAADKDRLTKPVASEYLAQHLPQAQLVYVQPGGHQALVERHREVNEAAARFIGSLETVPLGRAR